MTDIVKRLRAEDPECGLRHSLASEAADRIEFLERELSAETHSRKVASEKAWEFRDRIKELEDAMLIIASGEATNQNMADVAKHQLAKSRLLHKQA